VTSIVEEPSTEHISTAARGLEVTVYCREGRLEDATDRWATVHADGRRLWSGLDWVFQPKSLKSSIVGFFGFDDERTWKSFVGGKAGIDRPTPRMRELWVRPTWRARQIAEGFPEFRSGPVVTPEMAARQRGEVT
jgi:hypothetical protein